MSATLSHPERILNGRTFRLLTILPALNEDEPLRCECRSFDIDEAPPYEALSYVWGDSTPSANIWCNGQCIAIGPSLSQALKRLRYREAKRIIWADAICIDQADEGEKSHQVPMMGSIYSLARRVVVWLGQGDAQQIRLAIESSKTIADACYDYDQRHGIIPDSYTTHDEVKLPEIAASRTILSSLKEIYHLPWFFRIWCKQEILLAADALVVWGDEEIPWSALTMSARWIFDRESAVRTDDYGKADKLALRGLGSANVTMMDEEKTYPLLDALVRFHDAESSDPRDMVYGLLNIVSPRSEVEALGVDYTKSIDQVYADTVLTVIRLYSRLTAFAYITHHVDYDGPTSQDVGNPNDDYGMSGYRSWAPRWDDDAVAPPLGVPEASCPWSACGERRAVMADESSSLPEQLYLKGVVYSRVYEVGDIMDFYNLKDPDYFYDSKFTENSEDDDENIPDPQDIYTISDPTERHPFIKAFEKADVEAAPERFARTLTRGCSQYDVEKYLQDLGDSAQIRHHDACYHALQRLLSLQEFGTEGNFAHSNDSAQFEKEAYYACQQRRMFWTEKGSYGLGPQCMQTGDIVVVLYGGNTPYVLRPRGNEYIFMGQAYVDEIMNGEIFQGSTSDITKEQTFCLI